MTRRFAWRLSPALLALILLGCNSSDGDTGMLVGPAGGTVTSADGLAEVVIPPGALAADVQITIQRVSSGPAGYVGNIYEFGPDGTTFVLPVTITIEYDEAALPGGASEADLELATLVAGAWVPAATSTVDTAANTVSGETDHFSRWAAWQQIAGTTLDVMVFTQVPAAGGDSEIWVNVPGLTTLPLTNNAVDDAFPSWFPGPVGQPGKIAFLRLEGIRWTLWQMDDMGQNQQLVHDFDPNSALHPAWSPDGTKIAVAVGTPGMGDEEIWVVDVTLPPADPGRLTRVTVYAGDFQPHLHPTWKPDGTEIAFERNGSGIWRIPFPPTGGPTEVFTDPNYAPAAPHWGANGFVFEAYDAGIIPGTQRTYGYRIARVAADGTGFQWLTSGGTQIADTTPRWSPDDQRVLFVREAEGLAYDTLRFVNDWTTPNSVVLVPDLPQGHNRHGDW